MRVNDAGATILIIVVIAAAIGGLSSFILKEDDNAVEETAEHVIKHHTGIDIDLTPDSKEE